MFDDDSVETIKESDIPKYYGEGSSGAYVLFYQAVDMDREALGLPPDLPTPSAVEVVSDGLAVGGTTTIVVDPTSPPPDAVGVSSSKGAEEAASPPSSLPNAKRPVVPLKLDLPPPALNTSPPHSPVLPESVSSKANTPGLSKGAAGFFQSLRHSTSSKISMAKEKEAKEKEKEVIPPVPPTPLLNGDLYTNGHANGVKEKESKEGGGNIFRRSLKVTRKREPISILPGSGSPALPASPRLPSSIPPSPNDHRRPSGPQVPPLPTVAADETNVVPPLLPLPVATLPLPTRGSTVDDTNATASMSSSWTSASAPGPGPGPGPLSPVAQLPFSPPLSLFKDSELPPLPVLPPDREPSPAGSGSGSGRTGTGTGTGAGVAHPVPGSHSRSNSSGYPPVPDGLFQTHGNSTVNGNSNSNGNGQGPWASTTSVSAAGPLGGPRSSSLPTRTFKISLGGGEAKKQKAAARATAAAEEAQAREREREKKALEEKAMRKAREEREKEEREKDKEKEQQQQQQQQQNNKPQKRAVRKMSLSGMTVVGRLGASFGWSKDKDKHSDKDKDKGVTGMSSLPEVVRRGSHHAPMDEAEQDLPPERTPGHLAIGASPRFNS